MSTYNSRINPLVALVGKFGVPNRNLYIPSSQNQKFTQLKYEYLQKRVLSKASCIDADGKLIEWTVTMTTGKCVINTYYNGVLELTLTETYDYIQKTLTYVIEVISNSSYNYSFVVSGNPPNNFVTVGIDSVNAQVNFNNKSFSGSWIIGDNNMPSFINDLATEFNDCTLNPIQLKSLCPILAESAYIDIWETTPGSLSAFGWEDAWCAFGAVLSGLASMGTACAVYSVANSCLLAWDGTL